MQVLFWYFMCACYVTTSLLICNFVNLMNVYNLQQHKNILDPLTLVETVFVFSTHYRLKR